MEDILDVYQGPQDPERPLVCVDETSKQLIAETRVPIVAKPGRAVRYDYEYRRNGTANFVHDVRVSGSLAPRQGHRPPYRVGVRTDSQGTVGHPFSRRTRIVLVQDNLNTHKPASLYEAFPPEEARRLVERFEWHYTPKHGSWLDMAESELAVLSSQCLDRRIPDQQTLKNEVMAWGTEPNAKHSNADWQFTTVDARVKLKRLYPAL
jgi:DDE superfamily endonuclease